MKIIESCEKATKICFYQGHNNIQNVSHLFFLDLQIYIFINTTKRAQIYVHQIEICFTYLE